jgi:hypothetical protein
MGVVGVLDSICLISAAYPVGWLAHREGPAAMLRLVVNNTELEGRWIRVGRRFVPFDEAADELEPASAPSPAGCRPRPVRQHSHGCRCLACPVPRFARGVPATHDDVLPVPPVDLPVGTARVVG